MRFLCFTNKTLRFINTSKVQKASDKLKWFRSRGEELNRSHLPLSGRREEADSVELRIMAAGKIPVIMLARVRCEITNSGDVACAHSSEPAPFRLSLSKPSWIVKSESNVRREVRKKPNPPCVVCQGTGRVECHGCCGKGRTNHVDLAMLPKGVWPRWCKTCRGSGLSQCSRCLGTGEYRYIMGFQFMKRETNDAPNQQVPANRKQQQQQRCHVDLLLHGEDPSNGAPKSPT